jgi:hypothetical protein
MNRICGLKKEFVKKRHRCSKEPDEIVTAVDGICMFFLEFTVDSSVLW